MIFFVVLIGWWAIGAYVIWSAVHEGYVSIDRKTGWMFGAIAWPWVLIHAKHIREEAARMQPFEDWAERYDQEQIDKRLDELE